MFTIDTFNLDSPLGEKSGLAAADPAAWQLGIRASPVPCRLSLGHAAGRLLCTGCRKPVRAIAFVTEEGSVQLDRPRRARVPALAFALPHRPESHPSTRPGPNQHPSRPRDHPITDRPV